MSIDTDNSLINNDFDEKQRSAASESHSHVTEAADMAVKKVFAILGVDVDIPKDVEEFRENLRFGATMRRAADKGLLTIVGGLALSMLAAIWLGIISSITRGH